jgi:eukaryotic-like serine/threonine-protein kinase
MSNSTWQKIEDIFPLVADLPADERERRLRELCGGNEDLRREILSLLAADEKAETFIENGAQFRDFISRALSASNLEKPQTQHLKGEKIGAYRISQKIGAGGMGAVYLAERADGEFRKRVAIKLVKNGADSAFNLRRFRAERQILAQLEHPNIARLLDGGATAEGLPFLVMEYVAGKSLFDFCNSRRLNLRERLQLFRQICSAVEYAHRAGVVHRDIKPGNILVTDDGTAKLLDFGIAKIFDADLIHNSIGNTATLMRQMTPEYASPEQIKGDEIKPASDVYSLGVVLYELLTGERPYKFPSRAPHEIARIVCEENPSSFVLRPSLKAEKITDLEIIVYKALRKKASERYASVADFDCDVERFLSGLPISSGNTEFKIVKKHVKTSGDAGISLAVAPFRVLPTDNSEANGATDAGGDFLGVGLADALTTKLSGVRQLAVRPTSSILRQAANDKDVSALGAQLNVDYVLTGHILRVGKQIRVSAQLYKTSDDSVLWAQHFDEPDADVFRLQDSISERVAASLMPQLTNEEQAILQRHGTTNAAAYEAYLRGRVSFHNYTQSGVVSAEKYFKEAVAHDPNFALAYSGLADFYNLQTIVGLISNREGFDRAKNAAQKAIELDPNLSEAYTSLAFATWAYDWNFAEAERLFQKAISLNPNYSRAREWYAFLLSLSERHGEAIEEMRRAEQLDPNSPAIATMFSLVLYNARRYEESLEKAFRSIKLDPDYYLAQQSFGWICPRLGRFDEAIAGARRAVRINDEQALNKLSLALALVDAGQTDEARQIADEIERRKLRAEVPAYFLALIYANLGEDAKAFRWLDRAIEERGYWTLRMRVEPRFDCLRDDARFAKRLEKIKPLPTAQTNDSAAHATADNRFSQKYKYRRFLLAAATVAVLICVGFVVAARFRLVIKKLPHAAPHESTASVVAPPNEQRRANEKPRSADAVADSLYLAGKQQLETRSPEGVNRAIEFFTEATKRDPQFALAFSGLADAHIVLAGQQKDKVPTAYGKAEEYALKALALDPDLAEARVSLAMATFRNTGNFAAAEKQFLRAIEINGSLSRARHWYSVILSETEQPEAALREIKIAAELEPHSAVIHFNVGVLSLQLKRYADAMAYFDKTIELDKGYVNVYLYKAIAQQMLGDYDGALETYRIGRIYSGKDENEPLWILMQAQTHAANVRPDESLKLLNRLLQNPARREETSKLPFDVALVYTLLGDVKNACASLEKIEVKKLKDPETINQDPRFANLHGNACLTQLVEKWKMKKSESDRRSEK